MSSSICILFVICMFVSCVYTIESDAQHEDVISKIMARIETMEKEDQELKKILMRQQVQLQSQNEYIASLVSKLGTYTTTSDEHAQRINILEEQVKTQKQATVTVKKEAKKRLKSQMWRWPNVRTQSLLMQNENNKLEGSAIRGERQTDTGPIAFQARIDKPEVAHVMAGQKIVFDVKLTDIGGGYNNHDGTFTAPRSGIYIFSVSILSRNVAHPEIQATLMKNGMTIARVFAYDKSGRHDQGSVTIAIHLTSGDQVWVENIYNNDASLSGSAFTSFTGCLISSV